MVVLGDFACFQFIDLELILLAATSSPVSIYGRCYKKTNIYATPSLTALAAFFLASV